MCVCRSKWLAKPLSMALIQPYIQILNLQQPAHGYKLSLHEDVDRVLVGALSQRTIPMHKARTYLARVLLRRTAAGGKEADITLPARSFVAAEGEGVMVHLEMREMQARPVAPPKPVAPSRPVASSSSKSATFHVFAGGHGKETTLS